MLPREAVSSDFAGAKIEGFGETAKFSFDFFGDKAVFFRQKPIFAATDGWLHQNLSNRGVAVSARSTLYLKSRTGGSG